MGNVRLDDNRWLGIDSDLTGVNMLCCWGDNCRCCLAVIVDTVVVAGIDDEGFWGEKLDWLNGVICWDVV